MTYPWVNPESSFVANRIGRFYVSEDLINTNPEGFMTIMCHVIVVRAELMYHRGEFEYIALSPLFAYVEAGEAIPEYSISLKDDGTISVEQKK